MAAWSLLHGLRWRSGTLQRVRRAALGGAFGHVRRVCACQGGCVIDTVAARLARAAREVEVDPIEMGKMTFSEFAKLRDEVRERRERAKR